MHQEKEQNSALIVLLHHAEAILENKSTILILENTALQTVVERQNVSVKMNAAFFAVCTTPGSRLSTILKEGLFRRSHILSSLTLATHSISRFPVRKAFFFNFTCFCFAVFWSSRRLAIVNSFYYPFADKPRACVLGEVLFLLQRIRRWECTYLEVCKFIPVAHSWVHVVQCVYGSNWNSVWVVCLSVMPLQCTHLCQKTTTTTTVKHSSISLSSAQRVNVMSQRGDSNDEM